MLQKSLISIIFLAVLAGEVATQPLEAPVSRGEDFGFDIMTRTNGIPRNQMVPDSVIEITDIHYSVRAVFNGLEIEPSMIDVIYDGKRTYSMGEGKFDLRLKPTVIDTLAGGKVKSVVYSSSEYDTICYYVGIQKNPFNPYEDSLVSRIRFERNGTEDSVDIVFPVNIQEDVVKITTPKPLRSQLTRRMENTNYTYTISGRKVLRALSSQIVLMDEKRVLTLIGR